MNENCSLVSPCAKTFLDQFKVEFDSDHLKELASGDFQVSSCFGENLDLYKINIESIDAFRAINSGQSLLVLLSLLGNSSISVATRESLFGNRCASFVVLPGEKISFRFESRKSTFFVLQVGASYLQGEAISHGMDAPDLSTLIEALPGNEALLLACAEQLSKIHSHSPKAAVTRLSRPLEDSMTSLLAALVGEILGNKLNPVSSMVQDSSRSLYVKESVTYMEVNLSSQLNLADLCKATNVSARTLQIAFQDVMGKTPLQALQELRMNRLRDLLLQGMEVGRACEEVGLQQRGRLSAGYKRLFGELPRQTRQKSA